MFVDIGTLEVSFGPDFIRWQSDTTKKGTCIWSPSGKRSASQGAYDQHVGGRGSLSAKTILRGFLGLAETKKLNALIQGPAKPRNKMLVEYVVT